MCDRRRIPSLVCGHWLRSGVAIPLRDLELDSDSVSTKDHVAVFVAWPWLRGPIREIKTPVQEL